MKDPAGRSPERLRYHYEVEKALAAKLRSAPKADRRRLYSELYDELFRLVPDHPQTVAKDAAEQRQVWVRDRMASVAGLLDGTTTVLEIGPGDCAFSFALAPRVREVVAVDVSSEITRHPSLPPNFRLIISDGTSIDVPPGSVDLVYSDQLMEHLHPDDAVEQLRNIAATIRPGGAYLCRTPNRLSGPHDVSGHFVDRAEGFHLREYSLRELATLFAGVGLARQRVLVGGVGHYLNWPTWPVLAFETILEALPSLLRRGIARSAVGRALLGVRLIGYKS